MRNKITIDMMKECGCDCECIVSEGNGSNTLELYMWSVTGNPSIEIAWRKNRTFADDIDESRYDVNNDGYVDLDDVGDVFNAMLKDTYDEKYDINSDGYIDFDDTELVYNKVMGITPPEEGGSEIVEGMFLENGDYYYSIPLNIILENRGIALKLKWDDSESKTIYFNCLNLTEQTDFIVTRNLSCDDTYTIVAANDDTIRPATTDSLGAVQIGSGLNVDERGIISIPVASKEALGIVKIGSGLNIDETGVISTTGGASANTLTQYTALSSTSIRYNGITYTTELGDNGLIRRISDDKGGEFSPTFSDSVTDIATHNAMFFAVALLSGLGTKKPWSGVFDNLIHQNSETVKAPKYFDAYSGTAPEKFTLEICMQFDGKNTSAASCTIFNIGAATGSGTFRIATCDNHVEAYTVFWGGSWFNYESTGNYTAFPTHIGELSTSTLVIEKTGNNSSTVKVYSNGVLSDTVNAGWDSVDFSQYLLLDAKMGARPASGTVYQVRIYDRCLTDAEIALNANEDRRCYG